MTPSLSKLAATRLLGLLSASPRFFLCPPQEANLPFLRSQIMACSCSLSAFTADIFLIFVCDVGAGLKNYGYIAEAQRIAYRWLYMFVFPSLLDYFQASLMLLYCRVTCGFVEAGGVVPEKFNAVEASANIDAEYGNQVRSLSFAPD